MRYRSYKGQQSFLASVMLISFPLQTDIGSTAVATEKVRDSVSFMLTMSIGNLVVVPQLTLILHSKQP